LRDLAILGATGSIGTQTLEVVRSFPNRYRVFGLSGHNNIQLLIEQAREFKPQVVVVSSEEQARIFTEEVKGIEVIIGEEGLNSLAEASSVDIVVAAIVGTAGLTPTYRAIRAGKRVALANKETLVAAGDIMMAAVKEHKAELIPVDSEHSAIFQCIQGIRDGELKKVILTASGGPFRGYTKEQLENVGVEQALKHPNWNMGAKITIDSATLMNKGLEVIEAYWLFGIRNIEVVIHPQSIIHSLIETVDGSFLAQLGLPDMKLPIQYALTYPQRLDNSFEALDLIKLKEMTFSEPDTKAFPALALAYQALDTGMTMPAVLNAANEVAVGFFLEGRIGFLDIPRLVEQTMNAHDPYKARSISDVLAADNWAREKIRQLAEVV